MHNKTNITIEINGEDIDVEIDFDYNAGEEPGLHLLPEDCSPGEPEEFILNKLTYTVECEEHDISFLLDILREDIIDKLCEDME